MTNRLHYGTTAKAPHWTIVALLVVVQYSIGWFIPDAGPPGVPMTWHISIATVILALIVAPFFAAPNASGSAGKLAGFMAENHV